MEGRRRRGQHRLLIRDHLLLYLLIIVERGGVTILGGVLGRGFLPFETQIVREEGGEGSDGHPSLTATPLFPPFPTSVCDK